MLDGYGNGSKSEMIVRSSGDGAFSKFKKKKKKKQKFSQKCWCLLTASGKCSPMLFKI
jgi:hypothetical protein